MIGIVILNYRNWEETRRCVESIAMHPPDDVYRIILVDNASGNAPDHELRLFLERYHIIFIRNRRNLGYNAGNNVGIARALAIGCSHILLSNSDVRYAKGSIQAMKDYLDGHSKVGIVGPKVLDLDGELQRSCLCRRTGMKEKYIVRTRAYVIFRKSYRTYFGYDRDYEKEFKVHAVLGCSLMMSRQCAEVVTPFDGYPFLYEEELMLGIRMEEAGFATVYCPKAVVVHVHGASTRQQRAFSFANNVRSEIYYCRAYLNAARWQIYPLYLYRMLLYLVRCVRYQDFRKKWKWFLEITRKEMAVDVHRL